MITNEAKRWVRVYVRRCFNVWIEKLIDEPEQLNGLARWVNDAKRDISRQVYDTTCEVETMKKRVKSTAPIVSAMALKIAVMTELRFLFKNSNSLGHVLLGCAYAFDLDDDWWNKKSDIPLERWGEIMIELAVVKRVQFSNDGAEAFAKMAVK
jgi:hypothetical protein